MTPLLKLKLLLFAVLTLTCSVAPSAVASGNDGFKDLFNGENWDGWYLKLRSEDQDLARRVFAINDGIVHVFDDTFPEEYELATSKNHTHGMAYTKKKFSKFILRFDYKWGSKIANNFDKWHYDAGVYYHVVDDKIWPEGIEYQVRYDHTKNRNHTGDLIGKNYLWFPSDDTKEATFLHPQKGGKATRAEGWMHLASPTDNYHALDGEWNHCEVIVMGNEYTIHKLNGEVVNIAQDLPLSEGIIGFQSETAEIFYRNIEIKEFEKSLPIEAFLSN
ncbi:3-keto-disaccharide hydrolase [Pelagicoccus mobilis]|uniref:DUF1080 domain-containing protein n=1 Tax=Pelagicoccus mobilis TaxID=415221 RepID=A0A934VJS6_9BACT|nr:DUF1080 domain-containing protein [Pelagicoccus mobilis]MBK1875931.1 DUF1080 domain-containing protein [Pelagicoccus mobilis]